MGGLRARAATSSAAAYVGAAADTCTQQHHAAPCRTRACTDTRPCTDLVLDALRKRLCQPGGVEAAAQPDLVRVGAIPHEAQLRHVRAGAAVGAACGCVRGVCVCVGVWVCVCVCGGGGPAGRCTAALGSQQRCMPCTNMHKPACNPRAEVPLIQHKSVTNDRQMTVHPSTRTGHPHNKLLIGRQAHAVHDRAQPRVDVGQRALGLQVGGRSSRRGEPSASCTRALPACSTHTAFNSHCVQLTTCHPFRAEAS